MVRRRKEVVPMMISPLVIRIRGEQREWSIVAVVGLLLQTQLQRWMVHGNTKRSLLGCRMQMYMYV